jgi:prepilin-type N-terminal cleavage/methylation domain-containing protein
MKKKGFSLLEIIFVLIIIAIIITTAVSKFDTALTKTNLTQIKSDILQIRAGITLLKNKKILLNQNETLEQLDDNSEMLFNLILDNPIIATNQNTINSWSKLSNTTYKVYIQNDSFIEFTYNPADFTFDCDISNSLCKELNI